MSKVLQPYRKNQKKVNLTSDTVLNKYKSPPKKMRKSVRAEQS
jgi:hypothetical protein